MYCLGTVTECQDERVSSWRRMGLPDEHDYAHSVYTTYRVVLSATKDVRRARQCAANHCGEM